MTTIPLLSILIFLPIAFGLLLLLPVFHNRVQLSKYVALLAGFCTFLVSICIAVVFDKAKAGLQFVEIFPWVEHRNIYYHLGIDGIALPLIVLTTFTTFGVLVVHANQAIQQKTHLLMSCFLLLEGCMLGLFSAVDGILFYCFWEAMLIPMFLIIGIWGGNNRIYAAVKFFLYTFLGSVLLLVTLIYLHAHFFTFNIFELHKIDLMPTEERWVFWGLLLAFAVKVPMWPLHTWLPDAHSEAPTGGSMILAAILLKMGAYGMLRFLLPIAPEAILYFAPLLISFSLIAIVYIGFVALAQTDMKRLIAYSSVAHMGFVTLGIVTFVTLSADATLRLWALEGAFVQIISHGLISAGLFLSVGVLYTRLHSRDIDAFGGVANSMPCFAALAMFFFMANAGLPGTSGFVGEFMVIVSSFQHSAWVAGIAAVSMVLGAGYSLWMYKRVFFGKTRSPVIKKFTPIQNHEFIVLAALGFGVLLIGLWPDWLISYVRPSMSELATLVINKL